MPDAREGVLCMAVPKRHLCNYSSALRHNLSGCLSHICPHVMHSSILQSVIKDVQSKSFCRQMVWSLLHEGCPILIVRTDVIFIFLHYLPAPIICCSYIVQPCLVSEGADRNIHPEEWLFSPCQCFLVWIAVPILSRGPPSITKVAHAYGMCS